MRRNLAWIGAGDHRPRALGSVACLAFVVGLAMAFWAGAVWIAQFLLRLASLGG